MNKVMTGMFSSTSHSLEKGEGLKMELMINRAHLVMPIEIPQVWGFREPPG